MFSRGIHVFHMYVIDYRVLIKQYLDPLLLYILYSTDKTVPGSAPAIYYIILIRHSWNCPCYKCISTNMTIPGSAPAIDVLVLIRQFWLGLGRDFGLCDPLTVRSDLVPYTGIKVEKGGHYRFTEI